MIMQRREEEVMILIPCLLSTERRCFRHTTMLTTRILTDPPTRLALKQVSPASLVAFIPEY